LAPEQQGAHRSFTLGYTCANRLQGANEGQMVGGLRADTYEAIAKDAMARITWIPARVF